jgi:hypothetical protein
MDQPIKEKIYFYFMNKFAFFFYFLYQLSYNCFCQNQNQILLLLIWFILMQMSFGVWFFWFYYTVKNNIFSKIGTRETFVYQNFSLGKITKVDLQNPLKIVLFYENFNTVVTLDNQLNEIQKNFSESSVPIVATAIGIASQNQFWYTIAWISR